MSSTAILFAVALLMGCLLVALLDARRGDSKRRRHDEEEPFKPSRISFADPAKEVPLSERRRTLKLCPDCRELALLDATVCKYCGCALDAREKNA
jgi:hypothetical protein